MPIIFNNVFSAVQLFPKLVRGRHTNYCNTVISNIFVRENSILVSVSANGKIDIGIG
jgi:hypothetical protein